MTLTIRNAKLTDLDQITELLMADAEDRRAADPGLWKIERSARERTHSAVNAAIQAESLPFSQQWLVAENKGCVVGVMHTILLPVPPIYAGEFGPPGLIMEDCFIQPDAPAETRRDLLTAAEANLIEAGALILLASSVVGGAWETAYIGHGYAPLTMYFAKTGLTRQTGFKHVRQATGDDVSGIVAASVVHRRILEDLHHLFWKPHDDADIRFGVWMNRSLNLEDRDMFVSDEDAHIRGYAISHPATPLHFPVPHDISGVGVIDDFFHEATENTERLSVSGSKAEELLLAAEAARAKRGDHSILVVCPAGWQSKIKMLGQLGYSNAITWHIKMVEKL